MKNRQKAVYSGRAMKRFEKLMRWLFPAYYAEIAKCGWCSEVISKCRMVHTPDGWFCTEDHAEEYWWNRQW
jgi:hypothetical protein